MIEFIDVNYRVGEYAILTGINLKIRGGECVQEKAAVERRL